MPRRRLPAQFCWTPAALGLEWEVALLAAEHARRRGTVIAHLRLLGEGLAVQTVKQVSVSFESKPGRLANVLLALAREKVNISALTVMDSHEHSVLRFIANDLPKTIQVLKELNTPHQETEVLVVELRNQPGELAHVCEQLAAAHISIDYAYCSAGGRNGRTIGVFKVSNVEKAMRILGGGEGGNRANHRRLEKRPPRDRRTYTPR